MPTEIRDFFEHYREAFDRLDGDAVARLYAVPSGILTADGYRHWPDFASVRANMVALCELYRRNGYVAARFEPAWVLEQGPTAAVADVVWRIERDGGREPWNFHTTYNLVRSPVGWRVLLCTAYDEARLDA
jgi:hypothetical protein